MITSNYASYMKNKKQSSETCRLISNLEKKLNEISVKVENIHNYLILLSLGLEMYEETSDRERISIKYP